MLSLDANPLLCHIPVFTSLNYMVVSLNYCSQNGGNLYRAPYYNGNPNIGPRIIGNLDQSLYPLNGKPGRGAELNHESWLALQPVAR